MKKAQFLLITIIVLAGTTTAQEIILPGDPNSENLDVISPQDFSKNSEVTKYVKLQDRDQDISEITNNERFKWRYINTSGTPNDIDTGELTHISGTDYWKAEIGSIGGTTTNSRKINYSLYNSTGKVQNTTEENVQISPLEINKGDSTPIPGKETTESFTLNGGDVDSTSSRIIIIDGATINYDGTNVQTTEEVTYQAPSQANSEFTAQLIIQSQSGETAANTFKINTGDTIGLNSLTMTSNECAGSLATCYPDSSITADYETNIMPEKMEARINYGGKTVKTVTYGETQEINSNGQFSFTLPTAQEIADQGITVADEGDMSINLIADAYLSGDSSNQVTDFGFEEFQVDIGTIPDYSLGLTKKFTFQLEHPETGEDLSSVSSSSISITDNNGDTIQNWDTSDFTKENGIYTKEVYLNPENYNTGEHSFNVQATSGIAGDTDSEQQPFQIVELDYQINTDKIEGSTLQRGETHGFPFNITKTGSERTFSPSKINPDQSNITVFRRGEIGEDDTLIHHEEVTSEKLQDWYDDVRKEYTPEIPFDIDQQTGEHYIQINTTIEGVKVSEESTFQLEEQPEVFDTQTDEITFQPTRFNNHTKTIELTNYETEEIRITSEMEEELEGNLTFGGNGETNISADTTKEAELKLNYNTISEPSGELTLKNEPTNTERTVEINTEMPVCHQTQETICSQVPDTVYNTVETTEEQNDTINVVNFGEDTGITRSLSGNITDVAYIPDNNKTISGEDQIKYTVNPLMRGNFTGTLEMETDNEETLSWEIELESDIEPQDLSATVNDLELGSIPENGDVEGTLEIENTGTQPINQINIQIDDMGEVTSEPSTIENGETTSADIELQNVSEVPDNIQIEIEGTADTKTIQSSVSGSIIEDVTEKTTTKYNEFRDLESGTTNIPLAIKDQIDNGKNLLDEADVEWEDGNYQEAKDKYEEAKSVYNSAQEELTTLQQERQQEQQQQEQQEQQQQQESSGSILPILFGIILILSIAGFVLYSSVELEPGDPLYDVIEGE